MDPWYFPLKKEMEVFTGYSQPIFFINTERFVNVTSPEHSTYFQQSLKNCSQYEDITMLDCEHNHQNDVMVVMPFEMELEWFIKSGRLPKTYNHLLYQTHTWLHLSFLDKIGFNHTFDAMELEK